MKALKIAGLAGALLLTLAATPSPARYAPRQYYTSWSYTSYGYYYRTYYYTVAGGEPMGTRNHLQ